MGYDGKALLLASWEYSIKKINNYVRILTEELPGIDNKSGTYGHFGYDYKQCSKSQYYLGMLLNSELRSVSMIIIKLL
jgi:hypothetical protein